MFFSLNFVFEDFDKKGLCQILSNFVVVTCKVDLLEKNMEKIFTITVQNINSQTKVLIKWG